MREVYTILSRTATKDVSGHSWGNAGVSVYYESVVSFVRHLVYNTIMITDMLICLRSWISLNGDKRMKCKLYFECQQSTPFRTFQKLNYGMGLIDAEEKKNPPLSNISSSQGFRRRKPWYQLASFGPNLGFPTLFCPGRGPEMSRLT